MTTLALTYPYANGYVRFVVTAGVAGTTVKRLGSAGGRLDDIPGFTTDAWHQPSGSGYGEDYRVPIGETVTYVVVPVGATGDDPSYGPRATVTTPGNQAWLRDPIYPTLSLAVTVVTTNTENNAVRQHVYQISGRRLPLVVHDVREGRRGTVQLLVSSRADRQYIEGLLATGRPLLLTMCSSKMWAPCLMAIGNAAWTRFGTNDRWLLNLDYIEVSDPFEDVQRVASPLWSDILAARPVVAGDAAAPDTWQRVRTKYTNWLGVATGQRTD